MSTEQTEYYQKGGKQYHHDVYGDWYVNAKGYENLYYNQIKDEEFKNAIDDVIENASSDRSNLTLEDGTYLTVFINQDDPTQSTVSRKAKPNSSESNVYDKLQTPKPQSGMSQGTGSTGGYKQYNSGGQQGQQPKKAIWLDKDFVPLSVMKEKKAANKWFDMLPTTEASPNNYLIKNDAGINEMWVWMGRREFNW